MRNILLASLMGVSLVGAGCNFSMSPSTIPAGFSGVAKTVTLEANKGEFESIYIASPDGKVKIEKSSGSRVVISAGLLSETEEMISTFVSEVTKEVSANDPLDRELNIKLGSLTSFCEKRSSGAATYVNGVCVNVITIQLPAHNRTKVYVNDVLVHQIEVVTMKSLIPQLYYRYTSDQKRLKAIGEFVASHDTRGERRFVRMVNVKLILSSLNSDESRLRACQMLSGTVSDTSRAWMAAEYLNTSSGIGEAVRLLSR